MNYIILFTLGLAVIAGSIVYAAAGVAVPNNPCISPYEYGEYHVTLYKRQQPCLGESPTSGG